MQPDRVQLKCFISEALGRCLEAFPKLDEKEWRKKASGRWTAKEHLAHMAATLEEELLPLTRQALAGEGGRLDGFEKRSDITAFRQRAVEARAGREVADLLANLKVRTEELLDTLDGLADGDLDKPATAPVWDRAGTVRDLFSAGYLFFPQQYAEIRKAAKKKLTHWVACGSPESVRFQMDRTFHYMPLLFWPDRAGGLRATYVFSLEGPGGGQWTLRVADGRAETADGPVPDPSLEIRTTPVMWTDLTTGEANPAMAIATRKVQVQGNLGLAMQLNTAFGVE